MSIPKLIAKVLVCPYCHFSLRQTKHGLTCSDCNQTYTFSEFGNLDIRLKKTKAYNHEFQIGTKLEYIPSFKTITYNKNQCLSYKNMKIPNHLTSELLSYFPKASSKSSLMLDIGCGTTIHREVSEHAGYTYIGVDYSNPKAPFLGDAHALPLANNSVEFVLSIAVLEHIKHPIIMGKEIYRVLKDNGTFIGTVAFLEPFHEQSYYHHSHLGLINTLQESGFAIEIISPSEEWSGLVAQLHMGIFPKLPLWLVKMISYPIKLLHTLWWKVGYLFNDDATEEMRILKNTGSLTFIARK